MTSDILIPLFAFIAAASVLTITPGADTVMVIRYATIQGPKSGIAVAFGVCLGCLVWGSGAAFGLSTLILTSSFGFAVLKWAGAAYLLYLGLQLLVRPQSTQTFTTATNSSVDHKTNTNAFQKGFLTNLLNPKIGLFYISFLPQFIPIGINAGYFSFVLALIHVALAMIWFALIILMTATLVQFLKTKRVMSTLNRLTGCVFIALSARLAINGRI